jgi:hypothetical protein
MSEVETKPKQKRITYVPNPDGTVTFTMPNGESWVGPNPGARKVESRREESSGAAKLAALRARRGSLIEEFECEGEKFYLLTMDYETEQMVGSLTLRKGGRLKVDTPEAFRSFVAAVLQCGLVTGPKDRTPLFNPVPYLMDDADGNPIETTELEQWMAEPAVKRTVAILFDRLTDLNDDLWPKKKDVMALGDKLTA